jgi:hypothetical protein
MPPSVPRHAFDFCLLASEFQSVFAFENAVEQFIDLGAGINHKRDSLGTEEGAKDAPSHRVTVPPKNSVLRQA